MTDRLVIRRPDDMHVHLRSGDNLGSYARATARPFARAVVMPNLKPPVRTMAEAMEYRVQIFAALEDSESSWVESFTPLMTIYLTDRTDPSDIENAAACGVVGAKYYPAGATTNSDQGVTSLSKIYPVLEEMQRQRLPLLVHGEMTGDEFDVFDREKIFVWRVLDPLLSRFPDLRVVLEHVTTRDAVQFVQHHYARALSRTGPPRVAATITAHHLLENRNAIFRGGLQPHAYCLPVLKREEDRIALVDAATSGLPCFFAGTDSAPHEKSTKERPCGCAGCFTAPNAVELYAQAFDKAGRLERLEPFLSEHGANFYGLPLNEGRIALRREKHTVFPEWTTSSGDLVVPFWAGRTLDWKLEEP